MSKKIFILLICTLYTNAAENTAFENPLVRTTSSPQAGLLNLLKEEAKDFYLSDNDTTQTFTKLQSAKLEKDTIQNFFKQNTNDEFSSSDDDLTQSHTTLPPSKDPHSLAQKAANIYYAKNNIHITPSDFSQWNILAFTKHLTTFMTAIEQVNIPTNQGLAKIFHDMNQKNFDDIIKDTKILKKLTEYSREYEISPAYTSILTIRAMYRDQRGNYYFPNAKQSLNNTIWCLRSHEYHNILYKRHEAPKMPVENLVPLYYKPTIEDAKEILELNENNSGLSSHAIGAIILLAIYHRNLDWEYEQR